jgi:hypothetical protein
MGSTGGGEDLHTPNNAEVLPRTMNVPRMEQDTLDVANDLRNRFNREKIFVLGSFVGKYVGSLVGA